MSTPHNQANKGDIAKTVLMPGDPLRAKYLAETYLENVKQFNATRSMFGYTGTYKGKEVSIMGSGMGMPSIGIYSYELFHFYDVENIIRIGSCGAYSEDLNIFDTILVDKSYTEGNFAYEWNEKDCHLIESSEFLNEIIESTAKEINIPYIKGNTLCSDCFDGYLESIPNLIKRFPKELNIIGAEMEAFALFYMAHYLGRQASCLLTVVDSHYKKQEISSEERENSLNNMITLALESAIKIENAKG
mgnify:CR=1 FL=1